VSDMAGPHEASRTLDMGSPSSAAEDGASQQELDMELPASRRRMTKHSSSAGSRLTCARNCAEGNGTCRVQQDTHDKCRACWKSVARGKCTCD
jgi:hypothetical protein